MKFSWPNDRGKYRNPTAPLGYQQLDEPDIVQRLDDADEITLPIQEWIDDLDIFNEEITPYMTFKINSDSEDSDSELKDDDSDDIIEVPVEPLVKTIESICISDSDGEEVLEDNVKKEKENKTENKIEEEENRKEVKNDDKPEKKPSVFDDKARKSAEIKKQLDKDVNDLLKKKAAEAKAKPSEKLKHQEKKHKIEDGESKHKKDKPRIKTGKDKSHRIKSRRDSNDSDYEDRLRKYRSRSPNYEEDRKKDYSHLKEEYDEYSRDTGFKEEYPFVAGVYECDVCKLTLNSSVTFESHMAGKRHKKNVDAKNVVESVAKSYVPMKTANKIPNPPPGYIRIQSDKLSMIQHVVDEKIKIPSPGLHKVVEIQGARETSYYCSLCDSPCGMNSILPHLSGFKHQLNILKHYDIKLYNEISYKQKYQIEKQVLQRLEAIEDEHGRGRLKVEIVVPDDGYYDSSSIPSTSSAVDYSYRMPSTSSRRSLSPRDVPSTSKDEEEIKLKEKFEMYSKPDPNKAGFYCRLCRSHSNSRPMFDAHINGKRHIANLKKSPGAAPSKSRNLPAPPGTVARIWKHLKHVTEPIVGLDQIREIKRLDIGSVSYICFLCGGISVNESEIVDHITMRKHREKYLDIINYEEYQTFKEFNVSELSIDSVIAEFCQTVERERGRGEPEVYYAKNSIPIEKNN